jgi:prepilin-type N-terminal cleavage/methylation domain-containing protein
VPTTSPVSIPPDHDSPGSCRRASICTFRKRNGGFSLVEILVAVAIGAMLLAGLGGVTSELMTARDSARGNSEINRQALFAMHQMTHNISHSRRLLLPLADDPATPAITEHIRDSDTNGAVLAVTLPAESDLNADGIPDADNDGDGRLDEDLPADNSNDGEPGIIGIDDNGDLDTDPATAAADDDDESWTAAQGEDPANGIDDDGDGSVDEDSGADSNGDGCPGDCNVDDSAATAPGSGQIDEAGIQDDDEDGSVDEDWYDPVVFYLVGDTLIQRTPVPWDTSGDSVVTGRDYLESVIAENVSRLRIERLPLAADRAQLLDITLELSNPETGETTRLDTRIRVSSAL